MEDLPKDPALRELQEERLSLTQLLEQPGWRWLMKTADEQIHNRRQTFELTPLPNMDAIFEQEFKKGEISGIMLFQAIADHRIKELTEVISAIIQEKENAVAMDDEETGRNPPI